MFLVAVWIEMERPQLRSCGWMRLAYAALLALDSVASAKRSCYVAALHLRRASVPKERPVWILLTAGWLVLLLAWFAVDLFPGGANSVHVYTR